MPTRVFASPEGDPIRDGHAPSKQQPPPLEPSQHAHALTHTLTSYRHALCMRLTQASSLQTNDTPHQCWVGHTAPKLRHH
eukprot:1160281-Pelagomonas_calceolata.AAC.11